ncbi:RDD family protein [Myroides pelagicus]|uniref:RDD family protein n=1 Tax=Myroides pelagicus TaxID=270914 RepID=A0A7K1GPZ3_9FLAO|nr:RDD family protein [Myroides pelagicus]MEC4114697.1 RDD family protein [Myroides pelagicus]MTH30463.1 RDD family protein [Myroides pelagicus]
MANLTINTTQHIQLEFKNAAVGQRMLAFLLDSTFKFCYILIVGNFLDSSNILSGFEDSWSRGAIGILFFLPVIFYSVFFESILQGFTPGKKIMKIRVIKIDGYQATILDYTIRWIMNLVDVYMLSALIGLISISSTKKQQRIGDMLAGTAVISFKDRINLSATIFQEVEDSYEPIYKQVLNLSDNDVRIIKETYRRYLEKRDAKLLQQLVDKVKGVMGVETYNFTDQGFIQVVLKDYNYLTARL